MNGILGGPAGFTVNAVYYDNNVYDVDFLDPNLSNAPTPYGDDYEEFDNASNLAISFYQGHGADMGGTGTTIPCEAKTDCPASKAQPGAIVGRSGYGSCTKSPMIAAARGGHGECVYTQVNTINPTIDVCSAGSRNSNHGQLGFMALGENPTNGAWRGAGTDGGTSLALLHMSWGTPIYYPATGLASAFAGLHLLGDVMIANGDINGGDSGWGGAVASLYTANPSLSIAQQFVGLVASDMTGLGCNGSGSVPGGINGCGCYIMMTVTTAATYNSTPLAESWINLRTNDPYQNASTYTWVQYECNYNVAQYPWVGGDQ